MKNATPLTCVLHGGQRKLTFTFDKLRIRLGPKWLDFSLKAGQLGTTCDHSSALQS